MSILTSRVVLRLVDSVAVVLGQAYQLARVRLASTASPVLRLLVQRDHAVSEAALLRRELAVLRGQRANLPPHKRPEYDAGQRLAILQLRRLRGWSVKRTAVRFVLHPQTIRAWIRAVEGRGNPRLLAGAVVWNRLDDAVRWTVHELRRLCPEVEFGTRTLARHVLRAGVQLSRATVQRVLREPKPMRPPRRTRPALAMPAGIAPHHLLAPTQIHRVWHLDLLTLRVLWWKFTCAGILDGFSRRLLALRVYPCVPRTRDVAALVRRTVTEYGTPRFLLTDHGTQFQRKFRAALERLGVTHVRGKIRAPFFNGKMERAFRTFRLWARCVLMGGMPRSIQRRLDDYRCWYNSHRPHSALQGRTPQEAWEGTRLPEPVPFRARDPQKAHIAVTRRKCRGDPHLPVIEITWRRAA